MSENVKTEKTVKTEPVRPFCLRYADAKSEVFNAINTTMQEHGIPMFLMENILSEALNQVRAGAIEEMRSARDSYQAQMDDFHKGVEQNG